MIQQSRPSYCERHRDIASCGRERASREMERDRLCASLHGHCLLQAACQCPPISHATWTQAFSNMFHHTLADAWLSACKLDSTRLFFSLAWPVAVC